MDTACPTLYQYIIDKFFGILMMREYIVDSPQLIGNSSGDHVLIYKELIRICRWLYHLDSLQEHRLVNNELMLS